MDSLDWFDFNATHSLVPSSEESAELTSSCDASNIEASDDNGPVKKRPKIGADNLEESDIEVQKGERKKQTKILETSGEETEIEDKEEVQSSEDEQESDIYGSEEKELSSVQDTPDKQSSEEKGSPSLQDSSGDVQESDVYGSEEKGLSSVQDILDKQCSKEKGSPCVQENSDDEQESDVYNSEEKGSSSGIQDTPDKQSSEEKGSPNVQDSSGDEQESDVHSLEEKGSSSGIQDTPDKQSSEEKGSPNVQDSSGDEQESDVHSLEEKGSSVQDSPDKQSSKEKGSSSVQDSSGDEQESDVHSLEEKGPLSGVQDTPDKQSSEEKGSPNVQDSSGDEQESAVHSLEEKGSSVQDSPDKQCSEEKGSSGLQDSLGDEPESDVYGSGERGSSVQDSPDKQNSGENIPPNVSETSTPDKEEVDAQSSDDTQEYDMQVPEESQESETNSDQDTGEVEDLPIFQKLMNLASGKTTGSLKSIVKDWLELYVNDRDTAEQQFAELMMHCIGCHKPINWSDWKNKTLGLLIGVMGLVKQRGVRESYFQKKSREHNVKFQGIFGQFIQCLQQELFRNRNMFVCIETSLQAFLLRVAVRFGNTTGPLTYRIIGAHFVLNWYAAILDIICDLNQKKSNQLHRMKNIKENPKLKHAYIEHKKQIKEIMKCQDEIKIVADRLAKYILFLYFWDPAEEIELLYLKQWQIFVQHYPDLVCSPQEYDVIIYHIAHSNTTIRCFALKVSLTYIKVLDNEDKKAATQFYSKLRPFLLETIIDKDNRVTVATLNIYSKVFDLWNEENENLFSSNERYWILTTVNYIDKSVSTLAGTLIHKELQRFSRDDPKNYIIRLISYFKERPLFESRIPLMVNAICNKQQNWKMLISFLLNDDLQLEHNFGQREIRLLTELTISLVRKACTGTAVPTSKNPTKEVPGFEEERARMTHSFIKCIPDILKKHCDDGEKISNLVSICHYFINLRGAINECKAIVNSIQEILEYVRHPFGLKNCFQVLKSFSMVDDEILASCEIFVENIAEAANSSMKTSGSNGNLQEATPDLMLLTHVVNQFEITWICSLLTFLEKLSKSQLDTTLERTAWYCMYATYIQLFKFEPIDTLVNQKKKLLALLLEILKRQDAIDKIRVTAFTLICWYHEKRVKPIPRETQYELAEFLKYCVNKAVDCNSKNAETLENAEVVLKIVCQSPVKRDIFKSCVQNLLNILMPVKELPEFKLFKNIIYEALTQVTENRIGEILEYFTTYYDENIVRADNRLNSQTKLKKTVHKLCSFMTPAKIQRLNQEDAFFFHHEGIIFAISDDNYRCYPFLAILATFTKLLSKEKCKELKQFIETKTKYLNNDSAISFVKNYRLSLLQQEKCSLVLEKRKLVKPKVPGKKQSPCPPQLAPPPVTSESSQLPHSSRKPHTERSQEVQGPQTSKSKMAKRKEDLQKPVEKKRKLTVHESSTEDIEVAPTSTPEQSTKSPSTSHDQNSQESMESSNDAGRPTLKISHEKSKISLISAKTVGNSTRFSNLTEHCTSSDATNESDSDCSL